MNEQQSRKIAYQREVYASKQAELNQLDRRIEELQQRLKKKRTLASTRSAIPTPSTTAVVEPFTSTTGYRTAFDTVQDTLNNVKIAEIEKRMVQLANSFNATTSSSSPNHLTEQSNSPKKVRIIFLFFFFIEIELFLEQWFIIESTIENRICIKE